MKSTTLQELENYLKIYQSNPDSRVFAPLADIYRRLGRLSEAEKICREGLKRHPYYSGGLVSLGHVLLDSERFDEAIQCVESVITYYPENLLARKILILAMARAFHKEEALREFAALRMIAPMLSDDPEIWQALRVPSEAEEKQLIFAKKRRTGLLKRKKVLERWLARLGSRSSLS